MTDTNSSDHILDGSKGDDKTAPTANLSLLAAAHHPTSSTDRLRQYSRLSTDEALTELGDPDLGGARSASASLELDNVTSTHPGSPPRRRRMRVDVTLSVSGDGSCPPPSPKPPSPLPPPNPDCPRRPWRSSRWVWAGILLLLVVMVLLSLNQLGRQDKVVAVGVYTDTATVVSDPTASATAAPTSTLQTTAGASSTPSAVPLSPTALRLDDSVMPSSTVILDQSPDAACDGKYHDINRVPPFAISNTQNWVRTTATQWRVRCAENLGGATVIALDATNNVINRQIYGVNLVFVNQLTFVQSVDRAGSRTLQVDFYAPFNIFNGRTIYRFDSNNRISDAYLQDGFQRPLRASHFTREQNGVIASVTTEKSAFNGGGRTRAYTQSDIEAATRFYFVYDDFE